MNVGLRLIPLVLIFGIWYEVLPVYGWGDNPGDKILPTITLGTAYAAAAGQWAAIST